MSLRNPLLSGPGAMGGPGHIKNPLLSAGPLSSSLHLGLSSTKPEDLSSSSNTRLSSKVTTRADYTSSLLTTSNMVLSSSLFGGSILSKPRPMSSGSSLTAERDEARIAKLKEEALELRKCLSGASANLGLRSELLLSGMGGVSTGKLFAMTNLVNPLLVNQPLSHTATSSHLTTVSNAAGRPRSAPTVPLYTKATDKITKVKITADPKPKVVRPAPKSVKVKRDLSVRKVTIKGCSNESKAKVIELEMAHATKMPDYCLDDWQRKPNERITFESDTRCDLYDDVEVTRPLVDIQGIKRALINGVAGSLIRAPDFKQKENAVRLDLIAMATRAAACEPEFILKVALYTRNELNIRTTANFLLAFASMSAECRPFLRRYFSTTIRLPSDWIDVAEQYQVFDDKSMTFGALPAALRRVMTAKFPDFDKYQLAKYNKDSTKNKNKKKKQEASNESGRADYGSRGGRPHLGRGFRGVGRGRGGGRGAVSQIGQPQTGSSSSGDESEEEKSGKDIGSDSETEEELVRKTFTLKQLIRKLHITEPVEHVMCLIGKRYPVTLDAFYQSRLPGTFEEERADKRMKLPTPETWETQVSLKGNKASTWQDLIDHKKLPFMAMLRNLRNMIKSGMSEKHHNWVIRKLTDERAVANSRQFPFRFFSAYEVLTELEKAFEENQTELIDAAIVRTSGRGAVRGRRGGRGGRGGKRKISDSEPKEVQYDSQLIGRYRKALDTAIKLATTHNVTPIPGTTVIFVDLGEDMQQPCSSAKGLGKPRLLSEVGVLLGLMCKYSCEECRMVVYGENQTKDSYTVELEKGTILDNMESVLKLQSLLSAPYGGTSQLPRRKFTELLRDRIQVDNLIILSSGTSEGSEEQMMVSSFLDKYRRTVNPALLFVNVDLSGRMPTVAKSQGHENDVNIAGFSDQILRFVAERGASAQLVHIDKIDEAYNLKPMPITTTDNSKNLKMVPAVPEKPLAITPLTPSWRTARVFISSTFRDMHGERDLLTRFVFPELRARAEQHFINVYEVDLRWGVTEEQTRTNMALQMCLSEVERSDLFVGLLGERYGWVPDRSALPDEPEFDWVKEYPAGASVTELEMYLGGLRHPINYQGRSFFYFRNPAFESDIPKKWRDDFVSEDSVCHKNMQQLKKRLRHSGLEVMDGYPCVWGGVVDKVQPIVSGLDNFGLRVLNNLWTALKTNYPDEDAVLDEQAHLTSLHEAFMESHRMRFVGRCKLIKNTLALIQGDIPVSGIIMLSGKSGTGKTALVSELVQRYVASIGVGGGASVLTHILGAAPGSTHVVAMLRRLCHEMKRRFALQMGVPDELKNLVLAFREMLAESTLRSPARLLLVLEGLDLLEEAHQARTLEWLPEVLPQDCILVVSVTDGSDVHRALSRRKPVALSIGSLELLEKADVVRHTLALHRKALDESAFNNQMKLLTSKKEGGNPLYLSLACNVLRTFGVFEQFTERIKSLPQTIPTLLQGVLEILEVDHGNDVTSTALSLLACARNTMDESSLCRLLSISAQLPGNNKFTLEEATHAAVNLKPTDLVPFATFSRLVRSLRCFLQPSTTDKSDVLSIDNAEVRHVIHQRYMTSRETVAALHRLLAGYYRSCADVKNDGSWDGTNVVAFADLPYHMAKAGCYGNLEEVLCDLHFLHAKCQLGLSAGALEDFYVQGDITKTSDYNLKRFAVSEHVEAFRGFMIGNVHILKNHPSLFWQQALNEPGEGPVRAAGVAQLCQRQKSLNHADRPEGLLQWVNRPSQANPCTLTLSGLPQVVTSVAFSSDDKNFVCGSADGTARVYVTETGRETLALTGHSNKITAVTFVGSSKVCTASADSTVCLWDSTDGHRINVMKGHKRPVSSVTSDPSAKVIVSTGWDCQVKIWDAQTGKLVTDDLKAESRPAGCVAFHPEDEVIATGWWDATIRIYNIFHKKRLGILRGHSTSVRDIAYNPSGRHIASASLDGEVKLWSSSQGTLVGNLHCHALPINKLTFAPSGHELVTVSDDRQIKVWSGHLGRPIGQFTAGVNEQYGPVTSLVLCSAASQIVAGYHHGHVRMFDTRSGMLEWVAPVHKSRVRCVLTHENYIISCSDDTTTAVLKAETGAFVAYLTGHTGPVLSAASCPYMMATTSEDGTVCLYNLVDSLTLEKEDSISASRILSGHVGPVTGCTFNPEITKLATCGHDQSVWIWDMASPKKNPRVMHACHADWINAIAWSGNFLVTASQDFNLKVWDATSGEEKLKLIGHTAAVTDVAYQHGCIVSTCTDGTVKVWSHRGTEITTLHGLTQCVNAADIYVKVKVIKDVSPTGGSGNWADMTEEEDWSQKHAEAKLSKADVRLDDLIVAACSEDGVIKMWQPLEGNQLACLTGHADRVVAVACARNGTIITAARDKTVRLWRPTLEDTQGQISAQGHRAEVTCLLVVPGTDLVLSGSRDGQVMLWSPRGIGEDRTPTVRCSIEVSAKSVNCICITVIRGDKICFATGCNEGNVKLWNITRKGDGVTIKSQSTLTKVPLPPVTSLTTTGVDVRKVGGCIMATTWDGVAILNMRGVIVFNTVQIPHLDHVFASSLYHQCLFVGGAEGKLHITQLKTSNKEYVIPMETTTVSILPATSVTETNWVMAVMPWRAAVWVGDTSGQLSRVEGGDVTQTKIHKGTVHAVTDMGTNLVTSGADGVVRVWASDNLAKPVGQFFMTSPVTCVATSCRDDVSRVYCGDILGNVTVLNWVR